MQHQIHNKESKYTKSSLENLDTSQDFVIKLNSSRSSSFKLISPCSLSKDSGKKNNNFLKLGTCESINYNELKRRRKIYLEKKSLPSIVSIKNSLCTKVNNSIEDQLTQQSTMNLEYETNLKLNESWKINLLTIERNKLLSRSGTSSSYGIEKNWRNLTKMKKPFFEENTQVNSERLAFNLNYNRNFISRKNSSLKNSAKNLVNLLSHEPDNLKYKGLNGTRNTLTTIELTNDIENGQKFKNKFMERSRYSCKNFIIPQKSKDKLKDFVNNVNLHTYIDNLRDKSHEILDDFRVDDLHSIHNSDNLDKILLEYREKAEKELMNNNTNNDNDYDRIRSKTTTIGTTVTSPISTSTIIGINIPQEKSHDLGKFTKELIEDYTPKLKEFSLVPNDKVSILSRKSTLSLGKTLFDDSLNDKKKKKGNKIIIASDGNILTTVTSTTSRGGGGSGGGSNSTSSNIGSNRKKKIFSKGDMNKRDIDLAYIENINKKSMEIYAKQFNDYSKVSENTRKLRYHNIRNNLRELLLKLSSLKLTLHEFVEERLFSRKPFEREYSKEFIKAAKEGELVMLTKLLKLNKYLVYEYDHIGQTALHWACKRNLLDIVKFLIDSHSDVDALDMAGRPPLYFALRSANAPIVKMLLLSKARPWNVKNINLRSLTDDNKCLWYLRKGRQFDLLISLKSSKDTNYLWKNEAENFFKEPSDTTIKELKHF